MCDNCEPIKIGEYQVYPKGKTVKDQTGKVFGKIIVLAYGGYETQCYQQSSWISQCQQCGNISLRTNHLLKRAEKSGNGCVNCRGDLLWKNRKKRSDLKIIGKLDKYDVYEFPNGKTVIDLRGQMFGSFKVLEFGGFYSGTSLKWICQCVNCGDYRTNNAQTLKNRKYCRKCDIFNYTVQKTDYTGVKFGNKCQIIKFYERKNLKNYWEASCGCGRMFVIAANEIPVQKSCWKCARGISGPLHHSYNPNLTEEDRRRDRAKNKKYKRFVKKVYRRDNYKCQLCSSKKELNAHHLDGWNWCKEKRYESDNGITLCGCCHENFHQYYGYGNNTSVQFFNYFDKMVKGELEID